MINPVRADANTLFSPTKTPDSGCIQKITNVVLAPPSDGSLLSSRSSPSHFVGSLAQKHPHRNRFSDVLPNEPTRFKLASDPNFYFNANWVLDKQAIACQGPLETEINEFWQMVWHADVKTIAMLANPVELGRNKCSEYWKSSFSSRLFAALSVQCISETTVFEKDKVKIVERTIRLTKAGKTKEVTQYHLQNWPDFGVVEPEALAKLVTLIDSKQAPFLAHCSAGIGRTGTYLAAYQAYKQKTSQIYNIAADLRNPQKGRMGMIQTAEQYALARETAQLLKIRR